jgi:HEAT repeat protein
MIKRVLLCIALGLGVIAGSQYADAADKLSPPEASDISTVHLKVEAEGAECLLNLATGRIDVPVSDIRGRDNQLQWYKQIDLHIICIRRKTDKGDQAILEGIGLKTAEYKPPENSDLSSIMDLSHADIRKKLKSAKTSSTIPQTAFVFETDTGALGALRVTNADKNGITIQYMLAKDEKARLRQRSIDPLRPGLPKKTKKTKKPAWELKTVRRFKAFDRMLKKNGFVVTPEQFPQIFTAYITEIPDRENALPPFITTDSAWETYHVLLEEGVKQIEQQQAARLKQFSRRLLDRATVLAAHGQADFARIAEYASIALALQDSKHAAVLPKAQGQILSALKRGAGIVSGPVGFPLSAAAFRANSFYTSSPKLANYFSARQWYAMIVFPANDKAAISLAIRMTMLIDSDKELRGLWDALSTPYDKLLAKSEDGDIASYASAIRNAIGPKATPAQAIESIEALQKHLQTVLPDPQVNDQLLDENQHANFPTLIKGFRLLPPRRLTSSVCFQQTAPPGRGFPSALNFMVACKQMNSPAAVRALQQHAGEKRTAKIQQTDPGKLPDSLHGRAMKLIATLQKPPPENAPKAMKTQAWSDKQLWTQLGAWAQQRHTWALHVKMADSPLGGPVQSDAGMVSPYPEFFKSLGDLTRQTAKTLADSTQANPGNVKDIARDILAHLEALDWYRKLSYYTWTKQQKDRLETAEPMSDRILEFREQCLREIPELFSDSKRPDRGQIIEHIREMARRCLKTGQASKNDLKICNAFVKSDISVVEFMGELADICDQLATIARKQLAKKPLNKKENRLIRNYGPTLAKLHFYESFACVMPLDDSPIISPIFVNPLVRRTLYAALGEPHALYVVGELNGQTRLMLGAVMGYREFTHPTSQAMNDEAWRRIVWYDQSVPQPPEFTKSFMVHPDEDEIIDILKRDYIYSGIDNMPGSKITQALIALLPKAAPDTEDSLLQHILSRCTSKDAKAMLQLIRQYAQSPSKEQFENAKWIIFTLSRVPCKTIAPELMQLLTNENPNLAHAAAHILTKQPELIDSAQLVAGYDGLPTSRRALYCFLLGYLPQIDKPALAIMLKAVNDRDACVRWQGAAALGRSNSQDKSVIKALTDHINDSNMYVSSAAVQSLTKLRRPPDAKTLIEMLKQFKRSYWQGDSNEFQEKAIDIPVHGWFNAINEGTYSGLPHQSLPDRSILEALIQLKCKQAIPAILETMTGDGLPTDYIDFSTLKKLKRKEYPELLIELALNENLDIDLRVRAIEKIPHCDEPRRLCPRLAKLLGDKTSVSAELFDLKTRLLGDVVVNVIGETLWGEKTDIYDNAHDDKSEYTASFKKLRKKVRKWAKTATQPANNGHAERGDL